jgi:U3 small nucleolar RNA-associated protein 21
MSYSSARTKDWDDILTAHSDESFARSWTMLGKKLGKHSLGFGDGKGKMPVGSVKVCSVIDFRWSLVESFYSRHFSLFV